LLFILPGEKSAVAAKAFRTQRCCLKNVNAASLGEEAALTLGKDGRNRGKKITIKGET